MESTPITSRVTRRTGPSRLSVCRSIVVSSTAIIRRQYGITPFREFTVRNCTLFPALPASRGRLAPGSMIMHVWGRSAGSAARSRRAVSNAVRAWAPRAGAAAGRRFVALSPRSFARCATSGCSFTINIPPSVARVCASRYFLLNDAKAREGASRRYRVVVFLRVPSVVLIRSLASRSRERRASSFVIRYTIKAAVSPHPDSRSVVVN